MNINKGGSNAIGRLKITATEAAGVPSFTDWFTVPGIVPFNCGIGCSGVFSDPTGYYTLQFRMQEGGTVFDHPYIANIQTAAPDIAGNIAFPVHSIRFEYMEVVLTGIVLIPGFQALEKTYP